MRNETKESAMRVLLIEDDDMNAALVCRRVESAFECSITRAINIKQAKTLLDRESYDLLLCDLHLPDGTGFDAIECTESDTLTILISADGAFEHAQRALEHEVDAYLVKPLPPKALVKKISELMLKRSKRTKAKSKKILAIGAHPDDIELGCGGTLARCRERGDEITFLTLTVGGKGGVSETRRLEAEAVAKRMGAQLVHCDFFDTQLHLQTELISVIENTIRYTNPEVIYTHSANDRHQDHRAVNHATMVAARSVATLFCYQSPSTTVAFSPSRFVDISDAIESKLEMLRLYRSQSERDYMQDDVVRSTARYWSRFSSGKHSEPFEVLRESAVL